MGTTTEVRQPCLFACGEDKRGRPTLVARPAMHHASTEEESLEAVSICMDEVRRALKQLPHGERQILVLYDLDGATFNNLDLSFSKELISRLDTEFADTLEKCLVFNNHWTLNYAWSAVSILLADSTQAKVSFLGDDYRKELLTYIDEKHPYLQTLKNRYLSYLS